MKHSLSGYAGVEPRSDGFKMRAVADERDQLIASFTRELDDAIANKAWYFRADIKWYAEPSDAHDKELTNA